jgi:hypothetical protein
MDLWQLGRLLRDEGSDLATPACTAFVNQLLNGVFKKAADALKEFNRSVSVVQIL